MAQQQYSYGYGYQAYGYGQPTAVGYMQYPQQGMAYAATATATQQPSVGYTPYTPPAPQAQVASTPPKTTPQVHLPPPPGIQYMLIHWYM